MYATVDAMVSRYGAGEMLSASVADGDLPDAIVPARIEEALGAASAFIDSHLRRRYAVPLAPIPAEITEAACVIARYALALGGDREPAEQMRLARKEQIAWLERLAAGTAVLDGAAPAVAAGGGARVQDREPAFTSGRGL